MKRCREESRTAQRDSGHPPWAGRRGVPDTTNIPFLPSLSLDKPPANLVLCLKVSGDLARDYRHSVRGRASLWHLQLSLKPSLA